MSQREDLLGRLTELTPGTDAHRSTFRTIQKMINHGDYSGASTALDDLEVALHPAIGTGGPGGSGLPEQWTDGGHGDVTAATDDASTVPFSIVGLTDEEPLLRIVTQDDGTNYQTLVVVQDADDVFILALDSAGQIVVNGKDAGAGLLTLVPVNGAAVFGAHVLTVAAEGAISGTLLDIEADGKLSVGNPALPNGLRLLGPHAAPADGALNAGDLMFWFDQTNGAAKLKIKGKSANGTVVQGEVALS